MKRGERSEEGRAFHVPRLLVAEAGASVQAAAPRVHRRQPAADAAVAAAVVVGAEREHVPRAARDAHDVHTEQRLDELRTRDRTPIAVSCKCTCAVQYISRVNILYMHCAVDRSRSMKSIAPEKLHSNEHAMRTQRNATRCFLLVRVRGRCWSRCRCAPRQPSWP